MKKLYAWIFGIPLVYTEDFDGEIRLRIARYFGDRLGWRCDTFTFVGQNSVHLNSDGTTSGESWVKHWEPANKKARRVIKF